MDTEDYDRSELDSAINSICNFDNEPPQLAYIDHDYSNQFISVQIKEEPDDEDAQDKETNAMEHDALGIEDHDIDIDHLSNAFVQFKIDNAKVMMILNKLADVILDKPDEILKVEMCNSWGRCLEVKHVSDKTENAIQAALDDWSLWMLKSPYRDTPLLYICTDCSIGWWHLGAFREHLRDHGPETSTLRIHLDTNFHECNMVASFNEKPNHETILEIASDICCKCGNNYWSHGIEKYVCGRCKRQVYTCVQMMHHQGSCLDYRLTRKREGRRIKMFPCHICHLLQFTREEIYHHYRNFHTVRSDEPIVRPAETCRLCGQVATSSHTCRRSCTEFLTCQQCDRKFSCELSYDVHRSSEEGYCCGVCQKALPSQCAQAKHVAAAHAHKFTVFYKCILCDDHVLFLNDEAMRLHASLWHKRECKAKDVMEMVVLPKSCVSSLLIEDVLRVYIKGRHVKLPELEEDRAPHGTTAKSFPATKRRKYRTGKYVLVTDAHADMTYIFGNDSALERDDESSSAPKETGSLDCAIESVKSEASERSEPRVTVEIEENHSKEELIPAVKLEPEDMYDFDDHIEIKKEAIGSYSSQDDDAGYEQLLSSVFGQSNIVVKEEPVAVEVEDEPDVSIVMENDQKHVEVIEILEEDSDSDAPLILSSRKMKPAQGPEKKRGVTDAKAPKSANVFRCIHCKNEYRTMLEYVLHYIMHGYADNHCPICKETLPMGDSLAEHMHNHLKTSFQKLEDKNDGYKCRECDELLLVDHLFAHWQSHFELGPYDKTREFSAGLMVATEKIPKKKLQYVIKILEEKNQKHAKRQLSKSCTLCEKEFNRYPEMKRHLIEHLLANAHLQVESDTSFRCPICGCRLYGNNQFRTHMRNHSHFPVYQCEICFRSFSDSSNCAKHRKTHPIAMYSCAVCKKKFHLAAQLEKHKAIHQTQSSIKCKCCKKDFKQWSDYRRHKRSLLLKIMKKYPCRLCKLKFKTIKEKWTHQWEAHKLRDDESDCPICLKPFRRLIDVKRHLEDDHKMCTSPKDSQQLRDFFLFRKLKKIGGEGVDTVLITEEDKVSTA